MLVETLGVDFDEVRPEARFFHDLGGESIDVLDLAFQCDKRFGARVPFQQVFDPGQLGLSEDSTALDVVTALTQRYPYLAGPLAAVPRPVEDIRALFTVGVIAELIRHFTQNGDS